MYEKIAVPMVNGEKVTLTISNINCDPQVSNKSKDHVILTSLVDNKFDKIIKDLKQIKSAILTSNKVV